MTPEIELEWKNDAVKRQTPIILTVARDEELFKKTLSQVKVLLIDSDGKDIPIYKLVLVVLIEKTNFIT